MKITQMHLDFISGLLLILLIITLVINVKLFPNRKSKEIKSQLKQEDMIDKYLCEYAQKDAFILGFISGKGGESFQKSFNTYNEIFFGGHKNESK